MYNRLNSLADEMPTDWFGKGFVYNLLGTLGYSYESAIARITYIANYLYGSEFCYWIGKVYDDCFNETDVEYILNAYTNLAIAGLVPEFDLEKIDKGTRERIINTVAEKSGQTTERVNQILYVLYRNVQDSYVRDIFLYPKTVKENEGYRVLNKELEDTSGIKTIGNTFGNIFGGLDTVLGVAVFGAIILGGIYLLK